MVRARTPVPPRFRINLNRKGEDVSTQLTESALDTGCPLGKNTHIQFWMDCISR